MAPPPMDPIELAAPAASSPAKASCRRRRSPSCWASGGVEVERGRAVFELTPGPQHYNPIGTVHGGVALTLLDSAMGCAVHTLLEAGVGYTTLEVKTNFVRPIGAETGLIRCEGTVVHGGSRVATAEGRVTDGAGKLLAHGTTTCLILRWAALLTARSGLGRC